MKAVPLAERATLGALLIASSEVDPDSQVADRGAVHRWLRPDDFVDPWHAEVYRSIRALTTAGDPAGAEAVGRELFRRLGPTRGDVVRVAGLLHDLPPHAQAETYAVMVLEASLRRAAAGHGVLLRAGALQSSLDGSARPMLAIAAVVDDALDGAADRWAAATGQPRLDRARRAPAALRSATAGVGGALGADRLLAAHPRPTAREVADREATLIAALITHPSQIGATSAWLRPAALANRTWRPVYEAVLRLHTYGRPLDAVTVFWETQRSARTAGLGPDPASGTALIERNIATQPGHVARLVAGDHLRLAADHAAASLHTAAANPGLDLAEVLGTGHILAEALRAGSRPLDTESVDLARLATVHALPSAHVHRAGPVAG
ncbi:DnaB-like helicase N-terminal domain-containing protein [Sporichthya sp.]|uniref:DnaB-like helicase N-terminal domain-containing protein n=1 Tax=Sporichthya sp. TaxID=65475 RepID=UPI0017AD4CEE|nr:DnaB-like helicase N-terminal domain-containing protein [Sporichthya sp.]MBA3743178.1 hypothetical protein [Sporichthya sp.]